MIAPRLIAILAIGILFSISPSAQAQEADPVALARFEAEHLHANRIELRAMDGLLGGGILSTGVGIGLLATERDDQSLRVAGGISAGFGVVNLALGALGIWQNVRSERAFVAAHASRTGADGLRRAQLDDLRKAQKDIVLYGINLGLDVGYVLAGAAAVIASQLGADHDQRWLAGGLASITQGVFDAAVDLTLVVNAQRRHRRLIDALLPTTAVVPTSNGVSAQVGLAGRF